MHAEDMKMLNQNVKADAGKLRLTLVPPEIIDAIAEIRAYGNAKYPDGGEDNWRQVEVQRHWDAVIRHIRAAWNDIGKIDPESGHPHIHHAACDLAFVIALMEEGKNG